MLEDLRQRAAGRSGGLRFPVGVFQLAEDLRLAEHHRIEPAGDAEQVLGGLDALPVEQRIPEPRARVLGTLEKFDDIGTRRIGARPVDLGAIAGREDDGLRDAGQLAQVAQGVAQTCLGDDDLLADFYWRRIMVYPEDVDRHLGENFRVRIPSDRYDRRTCPQLPQSGSET